MEYIYEKLSILILLKTMMMRLKNRHDTHKGFDAVLNTRPHNGLHIPSEHRSSNNLLFLYVINQDASLKIGKAASLEDSPTTKVETVRYICF